MKTVIYASDTSELENDPCLFDTLYSSVSPLRREKTDRMRLLNGKCLSLGVESLLMRACLDFGIDYSAAEITVSERSKPGFKDIPVYFSLSHSGNRAMCVMSDLPAGCDVEKINGVNPSIAERFFSAEENAALRSCVSVREREELFFTLWTLKESFMKCTGLGFSLPLNAFSVSVTPEGISVDQTVDDSRYALFSRDPGDGYRYAWCVKDCNGYFQDTPEISFVNFDIFR